MRITVHKAARTLEARDGEALLLRARAALGREPLGAKRREGDGRTPEGVYRVCSRNEKSKFHLSLGLDYPNAADAERGFASGLICQTERGAILEACSRLVRPPWGTPLGGEIMIHGGGTQSDWTAGCIALDDADMDMLWQIAQIGTEVEILP